MRSLDAAAADFFFFFFPTSQLYELESTLGCWDFCLYDRAHKNTHTRRDGISFMLWITPRCP